MTPLPKRKHSSRRQGKRRAAFRLSLPHIISCTNCGQPRRPHQACPNCGFYKKTSGSSAQTS